MSSLPGCKVEGETSFNYGFIIYFALWPICDFACAYLNYRTILSKSEYLLADSISFNVFAIIKSLILFVCALIKLKYQNVEENCL